MPKGKRSTSPRKPAYKGARAKKAATKVSWEEEEPDSQFSYLQDRVKRLRDVFVSEYIKDFNATKAVRRMGYNWTQRACQSRGSAMLKEPYTQWKLAQVIESMNEQEIVTRNEVLACLKREANCFDPLDASSSSRVSALRTLAKCLGMDVVKVDANLNLNGGVMLVPATGNLENWEEMSMAMQTKLKQDVRT